MLKYKKLMIFGIFAIIFTILLFLTIKQETNNGENQIGLENKIEENEINKDKKNEEINPEEPINNKEEIKKELITKEFDLKQNSRLDEDFKYTIENENINPKINIPDSWDENIVGMKPYNIKEDIKEIVKQINEYYSTPENFLKFEPAKISQNISINYILNVEKLKKRLPEGGEFFYKDVYDYLPEKFPSVRLEKLEDIDDFTISNIQPFEILIKESELPDLIEKLDSLSIGVSNYIKTDMKDKDYNLLDENKQEYVKFNGFLSNKILPDGSLCEDGYIYPKIDRVRINDIDLYEMFFEKNGFIKEY